MARTPRILVVGAGVGGLAAAARLAARGAQVEVLERAAAPGGKMRTVEIDGASIDVGPTVVTMRWAFEELFADCGEDFAAHVTLTPADALARHVWRDGATLDLYADLERNAQAIRAFAGAKEADGYVAFARTAARAFRALDPAFMRAPKPTPESLAQHVLRHNPGDLFAVSPFSSYWRTLGRHLRHPRLKQLFARYATYCGASPYEASGTLVVVPHVERLGSWIVAGGMRRLAQALAGLVEAKGAKISYRRDVARVVVENGRARGVETTDGERIDADAVVYNGDVGALGATLGFGEGRPAATPSLSAVTWALRAPAGGAPLRRHNVLFGDDYPEEFQAVFERGDLPRDPTIYICAQDREPGEADGDESLFVLVNGPAHRAHAPLSLREIGRCEQATMAAAARWGLKLDLNQAIRTTPADFAAAFPGSRGALYGPAPHGWRASFARAGARAATQGLYLAGGTVHPGAGVPMAILSGAQAAAAAWQDWTSSTN